jgi:hypothetical protein
MPGYLSIVVVLNVQLFGRKRDRTEMSSSSSQHNTAVVVTNDQPLLATTIDEVDEEGMEVVAQQEQLGGK